MKLKLTFKDLLAYPNNTPNRHWQVYNLLYSGLACLVLYLFLPGFWREIFFWLAVVLIFVWASREGAEKDKTRKLRGLVVLSLLSLVLLFILLISLRS